VNLQEILFAKTSLLQDIGRTIVLSIIAIIYAIAIAVTIYLESGIYLLLTLPWSILIIFLTVVNHNGIGDPNYWFLSAGFLNIIIFLWFTVFKPTLIKSGEIPD
jgi:hypothetical protein